MEVMSFTDTSSRGLPHNDVQTGYMFNISNFVNIFKYIYYVLF